MAGVTVCTRDSISCSVLLAEHDVCTAHQTAKARMTTRGKHNIVGGQARRGTHQLAFYTKGTPCVLAATGRCTLDGKSANKAACGCFRRLRTRPNTRCTLWRLPCPSTVWRHLRSSTSGWAAAISKTHVSATGTRNDTSSTHAQRHKVRTMEMMSSGVPETSRRSSSCSAASPSKFTLPSGCRGKAASSWRSNTACGCEGGNTDSMA